MPAQNLPGLVLDPAHPLSRGLVGWWPMNEGGGARVNDVTGINPGMTILDPMWIGVGNSLVGHALKFNGSTQYINVPHSASLAIVRDLSCSVWCFPSVSGVYHMLITKTNGNAAASWDWYLQSSDSKPRVFMGNGTIVTGTTGTVAPTIGKWNHIAFTVSGTTVTQYLNGANNGSATNANARGDTGAAVRIGLRNDNFGHFSGPLSQARIYNRCLDAREVAQLYADPLAGALVPSRLTRLYTVPVASPPAAATGPLSSDRLYNRSLSRIFRRGETG